MKKILLFICLLSVSAGKAQQLVSELYEMKDGSSWNAMHETLYTYNLDGTVAFAIVGLETAGIWDNYAKISYTYNAAGKLLEESTHHWDVNLQDWVFQSRYIYDYDSYGHLLTKEYEEVGNLQTRVLYTYNQITGINTVTYYQLWDAIGNVWEDYSKMENAYDNSGKLVQRLFYNLEATGWVLGNNESWTYTSFGEIEIYLNNAYRETRTYDAGELLINRRLEWPDGNGWVNGVNYIYTNNPDGTLHQVLEQAWNIPKSEYRDTALYTYRYGTAFLGVEEQEMFSFELYPNPADDYIYLGFENEDATQIYVSDLQGKLLKTDQATGMTHLLSLQDIPDGIYLLKVERSGKTEIRRIVKS